MRNATIDKAKFVYVTYIESTAEKVWNSLSDSELTKDYWGRHRNISDWQVGSPWRHEDCDTGIADVSGVVLESDPPRRLVLSWSSANPQFQDDQPSRVTFLSEPFIDAVRLTVIHEELDVDSRMFHGASQGWPAIISSLKTLLEKGEAMPMTKRRWGGPPK